MREKIIMGEKTTVAWLAFAGVMVLVLGMSGIIPQFKLGGQTTIQNIQGSGATGGGTTGGTLQTCDTSQRATLLGKANDALNGTTMSVNVEVFDTNNGQIAAETNILPGTNTMTTNAPMNYGGYILVGSDDFQSSTARAVDYYYQKIQSPNIGCTGSYTYPDFKIAREGTATWTGYDDGTAEATTNITIGSGATVTTTELKIQAAEDQYLGNPVFDKPLGVCFNVTTTSTWDSVSVNGNAGTFKAPGFLSGQNQIGDCYVLNTPALKDSESYKFGITIKAASGVNPAAGTEEIWAILVDKCYSKDDNGVWVEGWGDESSIGTDTDCGMNSELGPNTKEIWVN